MKKKNKPTKEFADQLAQEMVDNLNRNVARDNSMLSPFIRSALRFALETHEIHQKQKRKGKDIPYITHPLTVGLILARAGAPEYLVVAGILHDTIEDSPSEHKVTREMLSERFGPSAADVVVSVSEPDRELSWEQRKQAALEHIKVIEGPALWVKSADVISNVSENLDNYDRDGDVVFSYFNASKEDIVANYRAVIDALLKRWAGAPFSESQNPMLLDLKTLAYDLTNLV